MYVVDHIVEIIGIVGLVILNHHQLTNLLVQAHHIAGIVLGVLALLGISQTTLLSAAVITFGVTLLLTSGEAAWLHSFGAKDSEMMRQLMRFMTSAASGAQVLVGLASLVLGILGLVGVGSLMMVLVGVLVIGVSILLRSSAVGGFLLNLLHL